MAKILSSHDLTSALGALAAAARRSVLPRGLSSDQSIPTDLAVAAVAFTVQLAIEEGRDPAEMRVLERELFVALGLKKEAV